MFKRNFLIVIATSISLFSYAENSHSHLSAISHAPIGVMGDHLHKQGEFMVSYRIMNMEMSGNVQGDKHISNENIVTDVSNPYAPPATIRVVPQEMTTQMHMLGMMYAPTDNITLMAMLNYVKRDMTLTTYQGMSGTAVLNNFDTSSAGLGDTKLGLLYRLFDSQTHKLHANVGWVLPTGSTDTTDDVLTPMNTMSSLRLPYSMQTGTGSHQGELGLTYNGYAGKYSWGAQGLYMSALNDNDEDYKIGDKLQLNTWAAYAFSNALSTSIRIKYTNSDVISGYDENIVAPVTTANPDNYGVNAFDIAIGANTVIANRHRVALEYQVPLNYKVNGVQMDMDNMLTLGYQIAF